MKRQKIPAEIITLRSAPPIRRQPLPERTVSANGSVIDDDKVDFDKYPAPLSLRPCPYQGSAAPPSDDDDDCDSVDFFESQLAEDKHRSAGSDGSAYTNESVHSSLLEHSQVKAENPENPGNMQLAEAMKERFMADKLLLERMYLNTIHENESLKIAFERANLAGKAALERLETLEASSSDPISRTRGAESGLHVLLRNIEDMEDDKIDEMQRLKRDAIKSRLKYVARIAGLRRRIQASDWRVFQAGMEREERGFKEGYARGEKDTTEKLRQESDKKEDICYEKGFHKGEQEGFEKGLLEGQKAVTFHSDRYEEALYMGLTQAAEVLEGKYSEGIENGKKEASKNGLQLRECLGDLPYSVKTPSPLRTEMSLPSAELQSSFGDSSLKGSLKGSLKASTSSYFPASKSPLFQEYFSVDMLAQKKEETPPTKMADTCNIAVSEEDDVFKNLEIRRPLTKSHSHSSTQGPLPGQWIRRTSRAEQTTYDEEFFKQPAVSGNTHPLSLSSGTSAMKANLDEHFKSHGALSIRPVFQQGNWFEIANKHTNRLASGAAYIEDFQVPLVAESNFQRMSNGRRPSMTARLPSRLSQSTLDSPQLSSNGSGSANRDANGPPSGSDRKLRQVLGPDYPQK